MSDVLNFELNKGYHMPQFITRPIELGSYYPQLADIQKITLSLSVIAAIWLRQRASVQYQYHQIGKQLRALCNDEILFGQFMLIPKSTPELGIHNLLSQLCSEAS